MCCWPSSTGEDLFPQPSSVKHVIYNPNRACYADLREQRHFCGRRIRYVPGNLGTVSSNERGDVAILDLGSSDGATVAKDLGGHFFPCDVTDYAGMDQILEAIDALGGLHFVINTAAAIAQSAGRHSERSKRTARVIRPTFLHE